ncbi:hypothetical protein Tco_0503412 [Tanacetum coccineum]
MRILSVISVKVFEKYEYNYLREIILHRANYQEYKILEKDFKSLHPNDFEDLFLLNIQEKLNHLPKTDKTSLHTAVNMWIRNLDATDYYFKEDYTIVLNPRAVVYKDKNDQRKLMRLNELHKLTGRHGRQGNVGQRMTREKAKTSSLRIGKTTDSGGIFRSLENLCWRENKRFRLQPDQQNNVDDIGRYNKKIKVTIPNDPAITGGFYPNDNPLVSVEVLSETIVFHNEYGNPARANIKQALASDDGSLDLGSPGVIVLGYDGLPMMPEDPYAYVKSAMQEPPPPNFVPEPVYPEFMPPEDDVLPAEKQPLPAAVLPTADLPGYITESDPEEHPEEDDEDPEEDPADYPADKDDDDEEESSRDDADDEDEEEEEHLALADSVPPPVYRTTAGMSIQAQTPIPFLSKTEVDKLLAIPTPPSSPLTSLSSPLPRIPSPPFPVPSPLPSSPTHSLGYRAAMIWLRAESPSTSHALPLPPPIVLPHTRASMVMMRADAPADILEVMLPPWKRLCVAPGPRYEVGECSSAPTARPTGGFRVDYGFVGTLDAEIRRDPDREIGYEITDVWEDPDEIIEEISATDVAELGQRMIDFVTTVRQDTDEIYRRLEDAQDDRLLMSGQLNLLRRDRRSHARMARLMKSEARASREAWVQSMDASDMTHSETQMAALQSKQRPARDPTHSDVPPEILEEAGSSS